MKFTNRIIATVIELLLVAVCAYVSLLIANTYNLIPAKIVFVPHQFIASFYFPLLIAGIVVAFALFFILSWFFTPPNPVSTARGLTGRLFGGALTLTLAAIWVYLFSGAPFNPGLFIAAGAILLMGYILAYIVYGLRHKKPLGQWLASGIKAGFGGFIRPLGIATLLVCLAPVVMLYVYSHNRDFSDFVTQFRLSLIPDAEYSWGFENALNNQVLQQPIDFRFSPVDSNVIYVLSRLGGIYRVHRDASQPAEELIDFSDAVAYAEVELGALSIALHPEFGQEGSENSSKVFAYYTIFDSPVEINRHPGMIKDAKQYNRLSSFDLSPQTADERKQTEVILMNLARPSTGSHNGGSIEFGEDGFLYISIGESSVEDSQGTIDKHLFGGVLRIDVDKTGGDVSHPIGKQPLDGTTQEYYIPSDNPFVGVEGALEEFWAYGMRNPFRFSFDSETNEMWLGDVGTGVNEEVNLVVKGGNYQFPYREGFDVMGEKKDSPGQEVDPFFVYIHNSLDRSIIGGVLYRGPRVEWVGMYLFADNYSGKVSILNPENTGLGARAIARVPEASQRGISSIRISPSGELLLSVLGNQSQVSGRILTLLPEHELENPIDGPVLLAETGEVIGGATVYSRNCALCHGLDGTGKGDTSTNTPMPDFTDSAYSASRSVEAMTNIVKNGGTAEGLSGAMPPWGEIISESEIDSVVEYIRSLGGT